MRQHLARNTVYLWLHRFEERGLLGLEDEPRGGRPPTYPREQVGEIVAAALSSPQSLGLPFRLLDARPVGGVSGEHAKGIAMKRSRIDEVLLTRRLALAQTGDVVR